MSIHSKRTILFLLSPSKSHLGITFKVAKALKEDGFRVIYAANQNFKELIEQQGFEYYQLTMHLFLWFKPELIMAGNSIFKLFFTNLFAGKNNRYFKMKLNAIQIKKEIQKINPDIIFLDSYYVLTYIFLHKLPARIVSLNTQILSEYSPGIPPINSAFVPNKMKKLNELITRLLWNRFFFYRFCKERIVEKILFCGNDNFSLLKKFSRQELFPLQKKLDKRKFYYGFKGLEEISFVPYQFDFCQTSKTSLAHGISMVDNERYDETNSVYLSLREHIVKIKSERNLPLIYCCLGTLSTVHSSHCRQFYKKLVQSVQHRNLLLVISGGKSEDLNYLKSLITNIDNIFAFEYLPQLDILKYADVMINHGGISSILECIYEEVPMIVYPLSSLFDQKGNAARVAYHGLGMRGNIKRVSKLSLTKKINHVLHGKYKERISEFNSKLSYKVDRKFIMDNLKII